MKLSCVFVFLATGLPTVLAQELADLRGPVNGWVQQTPVWTANPEGERLSAEGRVRQLPVIVEDILPIFADQDDNKTVLLRIFSPGAAALHVHFSEFHLPAGSRAFVYGLTSDGTVTRIAGPYTGSGPLNGGEFWARPVPGETAVVELQLAEGAGTLPVAIREVGALDSIEDWADSPDIQTSDVRTSIFRGMKVTHAVIGGQAILEGDIVLGPADELQPFVEGKTPADRESMVINGAEYRWPGGVVPYAIDPALKNPARITGAIAQWNTKLAGYITLVLRTNEANYIIYRPAAASTCSSYVGRIGGAQPINTGDYCSTGNMIHETGHAIGLFHEHTRTDRATYVQILNQNVDPATVYNFEIMPNSINPSPYDYNSIMHYSAYAFSINGQPTIVTIPPGIPIGQRSVLSDGDIAGVKGIYPAVPGGGGANTGSATVAITTAPITISSIPTGRVILVDDQTLTTPVTQMWPVGSLHTITAPTATYPNGVKYVYTGWSDGGSQQHQVAVTASATYTANFSVQYLLTTKVNSPAGGSVSRTPVSADNFYPSGAAVNISATPAANHCFFGWSGLLPVTTAVTAVTMSRPQIITANFEVGAVSVPSSISIASRVVDLSVSVAATRGCIWKASSQASWITVQNPAGQSSGPLHLMLGSGALMPRTGSVQVNDTIVKIIQAGQ